MTSETNRPRYFAVAKGVPFASIVVPLSGIMEIVGSISIMFGWKARIGALLLIVFMIPVTLIFHQFWMVKDPMGKQMDMIDFFKNISMLGGALIIAYFGSGELSLDNALKKSKNRLSDAK